MIEKEGNHETDEVGNPKQMYETKNQAITIRDLGFEVHRWCMVRGDDEAKSRRIFRV
ncbi:hypothetical protein ASPFODRAFT_53683 [Aspergillus luchuensis CBS 106.47]|uniref:Uncharacterized protein n=1 Tax=Aspergillus luchuensis (strain CBS 106.47) TaxID=1137211 RepID=A0A1M3T0L8_ASPLC|nr:hypothetical protein ASPFODRAFT_53683 [Aspergillus luchuensis CBS 106.47]